MSSKTQRLRRLGRTLGSAAVALALIPAGCGHSKDSARSKEGAASKGPEKSTIRVVHPEKRDIRMLVVQPGTIQAYETTPIFARITGYVDKYRYNIGDRVKAGDILLNMWVPDIEEQLAQKTAAAKRAEVQIRLAQSSLLAAEARLETAKAAINSAQAGVKRAQASYSRWESEYKRLEQLVANRVLDQQVRDETYRQFEEAVAARDQANAMVAEATADRDRFLADRDRAKVDIDAAKADLVIAQAEERLAKVWFDYAQIKAPYDGVITTRNISPGDYLQPGGGSNTRPLFVLEQTDPVRVFVGVPELASAFIKEQDTATIRIQAIPGATRVGKVVRSGFSLNPMTRTLQTEIDIPNSDDHLRPGMYVTVSIAIERRGVMAIPSNAINFQGSQNYSLYLKIDDKPVRTSVLIGPSDDLYTEVLRKRAPNTPADAWVEFDGTEHVMVGNLDALGQTQAASATEGK